MKDEAREKQAFDVFLSHNSKDKPGVRALAALLTERGISVWIDEEQLIPGRPWQPLLEKGIKESATGAVLVGADGVGPWENEEMQGLLQFVVQEKKPVIPVLLPGAPGKPDPPLFLSNRTWVDLRAGFGTEGIDRLIWGVTGEHPGRKPVPARASEPIIAVTRLRHGANRLVGREKELTRLDTAWQDPKTRVVTIVAWGGVGKTALVFDWMAQMAKDGWRGAEQRAVQTLKWVTTQNWLLDVALDHLTLGCAALYRAIMERSEIRDPKSEIEQAMADLRRAGQQNYLPRGLLTRAWLRFLEGNGDGSRADLDEAWEIAERGPMRLFMADIHLYRARLFHGVTPYPWNKDEQGKPRGPHADLAAARKLIEDCGYHRRDEELADAEEAAKSW